MIVRQVITDHGVVDRMDIPNDAKDTISWLDSIGEKELADRIRVKYQQYLASFSSGRPRK